MTNKNDVLLKDNWEKQVYELRAGVALSFQWPIDKISQNQLDNIWNHQVYDYVFNNILPDPKAAFVEMCAWHNGEYR